MKKNFRKQPPGFSLIELLVSLSLFTVVITIAVGTLLVLIDANNKAQNIQSAMTNLNFALDSMTREIRTGSNYVCKTTAPSDFESAAATRDCGSGKFLSIVEGGTSLTGSTGSHRVEYTLNAGKIERRIDAANKVWIPLTASNVNIDRLEFTVSGSARGDTEQPTVTIFIAGTAGEGFNKTDAKFSLQTTVTQRQLDI